jgi:hypothetical protein
MRKQVGLITLGFVLLSLTAQAQLSEDEQMRTLFGSPEVTSVGGYGVLDMGYTQINQLDAVYIGARAMAVINHSMAFGLGGKAIISRPVNDVHLNHEYEFAGGYGGVYVEPIVGAFRPVHLSFPVLIGAGGIGYLKHWGNYDENENDRVIDEDSYAYFVFEPGVELEFNVIKWMRFALVGSYRLTSDVKLKYDKPYLSDADYGGTPIAPSDFLRSYNVGIVLKFGRF